MVTLAHPPTWSSLKITNRSFQYAAQLVYETNSPLIFASLVRYSLLQFHLSHMAIHHLLQHLHLHLLLLVQSFILNLRLGFLANVNVIAQRLDLFTWCVRLSRLYVGFRMHLKSLHFHSFRLIQLSASEAHNKHQSSVKMAWHAHILHRVG